MRRLALAIAFLSAASCELLLPSFKECAATRDCQSHGSNYVCQKSFCIPLPQGCQYVGAQDDPALTFGLLLPKTNPDGTVGAWGPTWEKIVQLVATQINTTASTGIRNMPVRFISCDTTSDNNHAADLAGYMIDAGVRGILSDGSGETISEAALTVPANVLLLSGAATSPQITFLPKTLPGSAVPLVWRTTPSDALQAPVIAKVLQGTAGVDAGSFSSGGGTPVVAVFERNDAYGQGLTNAFTPDYPSGFIKPPCLYPAGGDVTSAISQCAAYGADVVVAIGFPNDVTSLVNGAAGNATLSNTTRWFFTQGGKFPGLFMLNNPGPLGRAIGTAPAASDPTSLPAQTFTTLYAGMYNGDDPTSVVDVANIYDAAMLLMIAADYATAPGRTLDGVTLATALTHVSGASAPHVALTPSNFAQATSLLDNGSDINIDGASGALDFDDATGEAPANIEIWTVADGGFVTLAVVPPS